MVHDKMKFIPYELIPLKNVIVQKWLKQLDVKTFLRIAEVATVEDRKEEY